jgi:hypothetical protein
MAASFFIPPAKQNNRRGGWRRFINVGKVSFLWKLIEGPVAESTVLKCLFIKYK